MSQGNWERVHGASVHFPIALVLCSGVLDILGRLLPATTTRLGLRSAGYWTLLAGALGAVPAAVSGLLMTRGVVLGHDALRMHHLFAWPALALVVALATWRAMEPPSNSKPLPPTYFVFVAIAAALVTGAGYWGGELLVHS